MPAVLFALGVVAAGVALFAEPLLIAHRLAEEGRSAPKNRLLALVPLYGVFLLEPPAPRLSEGDAPSQVQAPRPTLTTSIVLLIFEIGLGLLFVALGRQFHYSLRTAVACAYCALLFQISIIDLHYRRVLDILAYPGVLLALAGSFLWSGIGPLSALLGGAVAFVVFFVIEILGRGQMGRGDTTLAGLIGVMRGYPAALTALFAGVIVGGMVAALLLVSGHGRKQKFAYGPWLAMGAAISFFVGGKP